ncbi:MAG: hypothetical protein Q8830_03685, partial [Candidatus Phytoplasma australasiaticum]|nr:hypothetical protein [Candidatus Phytoplasma australasiaticum]
KNYKVPSVLLSGDHKKIYKWRLKESLKNTFKQYSSALNKPVTLTHPGSQSKARHAFLLER